MIPPMAFRTIDIIRKAEAKLEYLENEAPVALRVGLVKNQKVFLDMLEHTEEKQITLTSSEWMKFVYKD
jgi:hypothetical protein